MAPPTSSTLDSHFPLDQEPTRAHQLIASRVLARARSPSLHEHASTPSTTRAAHPSTHLHELAAHARCVVRPHPTSSTPRNVEPNQELALPPCARASTPTHSVTPLRDSQPTSAVSCWCLRALRHTTRHPAHPPVSTREPPLRRLHVKNLGSVNNARRACTTPSLVRGPRSQHLDSHSPLHQEPTRAHHLIASTVLARSFPICTNMPPRLQQLAPPAPLRICTNSQPKPVVSCAATPRPAHHTRATQLRAHSHNLHPHVHETSTPTHSVTPLRDSQPTHIGLFVFVPAGLRHTPRRPAHPPVSAPRARILDGATSRTSAVPCQLAPPHPILGARAPTPAALRYIKSPRTHATPCVHHLISSTALALVRSPSARTRTRKTRRLHANNSTRARARSPRARPSASCRAPLPWAHAAAMHAHHPILSLMLARARAR